MDVFNIITKDSSLCTTYSTIEQIPKKDYNTVILHLNIRSLRKNFDEFCVLLDELSRKVNIGVITLTEANIRDDYVSIHSLGGFETIYNLRNNQRGGGVIMMFTKAYLLTK